MRDRRPRIGPHLGRARRFLQICSDLVETIPSADDNIVQKLVKIASIAETILVHVEGEDSAIEAFVEKHKLQRRDSGQFVNLFFSTPLNEIFETAHVSISETCDLVRAQHEKLGTLYFVERTLGRHAERGSEFFHTGVDFAAILEKLWGFFNGRINVRIHDQGLTYGSFPAADAPIHGPAQKRVDALVKKHLRYQVDDESRTYLFIGMPGLGKSTQAMHVAQRIGRRLLRMDAVSLARFHASEMSFLLGALAPDVLIVDDIDKGGIKAGRWGEGSEAAGLLSVMEWMKSDHPDVAMLLTANGAEGLPDPMLRPGRIDDIILYKLPNKIERRAVLKGFAETLLKKEQRPTAKFMTTLVAKTDGLGHAWLREVILQCRYEPQSGVLLAVTAMKQLVVSGGPRMRRARRRTTRRVAAAPEKVPKEEKEE